MLMEQVHHAPVIPEKYPMNSIVQAVQFNSNYSDDVVYQQWQPLTPFSQDETKKEEQDASRLSSTELLSTFMSQVNVWDALREEKPKYMFNVDASPLYCASWSPHDPHSLIVTGGCDRSLKIIDVRSNGVVWQADEAHARPIRDAKFNTFIPYWLASAGEDAIVNIFDIRACYHAPVAKISGHDGIVESLSWSNMRCENLATTSSDGTMRYWALNQKTIPVESGFYETAKWSKNDTPPATIRPQSKLSRYNWFESQLQEPWSEIDRHIYYADNDDPWGNSENYDPETMAVLGAIGIGEWGRSDKGPVYIGEDFDKSKGPVVGVSMSKWLLADYYCITTQGQLCVQSVRLENKEKLDYNFRFDKNQYPLANQIEYEIYSRHIDQARENLEQLRNVQDDEDGVRNGQVQYLEECLRTVPPISSETWSIDTIPDKKDRRISRRLWNADDLWDFAISTFSKDLDYWGGCRLPPGYAARYGFPLNVKERTMTTTPIISSEITSHDDGVRSSLARSQTTTRTQTTSSSFEAPSETTSQHSYERASSMSRSRTSRASTPSGDYESSSHHHQNRFVKPAKSLKRMFSSRRGKGKQPSSKKTEQEEVVADEAPPEPPLTRKFTTRRNALFGAS
ncbi:WD40-repeat-containing domain protein [Fennellomyces sp. T-0311]|nr:WD40-repeat-containing domain protein [Fennellomyces sp. T-0311]